MPLISDLAVVCKSKNAGPFEVTIDAVFADRQTFEKVKASGVLCAAPTTSCSFTPAPALAKPPR